MNSSLYFCVAKRQCNYNCTPVVSRPNLCYHFAAPPTLSRLSLFCFRTTVWVAFIVGFFQLLLFPIRVSECVLNHISKLFCLTSLVKRKVVVFRQGLRWIHVFMDARKEGRACKRCAEAWRQQCWRVVQSTRLTILPECEFYGCRRGSSATRLHASTTTGFEARNPRKFWQS